jgi:hypothetical protein
MTTPGGLTPTQRRIIELAKAMAANNPHAAEELAKHLAHYSGEQLRPRFAQGAGIVIRYNHITDRIDLRSSEE